MSWAGPQDMWAAVAVARAEAERQRMLYGLMVLDSLVLPWHAMAGRFDECEAADRAASSG